MRKKLKFPPSLAAFHHGHENKGARVGEAVLPPLEPEVVFKDEFAPSSSLATDPSDSGILETKAGRLFCYNDHVIDLMEGALDRACELGAPRLHWLFPLQYQAISSVTFQEISLIVAAVSEGLEEQSDDWLSLKCYLCWLDACHAVTDGGRPLYAAERMFVAGATAREFELAARNRGHATRGRNQFRYLNELRSQKNNRAKTDAAARRAIVAQLSQETRLTGGALEKWLVCQLVERHGIKVSQRTVRGDRKALRD